MQLLEVDSEAQSVKFKMVLSIFWKDPRWLINPREVERGSHIPIYKKLEDLIWTPDLWIANLLSSERLKLLNLLMALGINAITQVVNMFDMVIIETRCPMAFDIFPFSMLKVQTTSRKT